MDRKALIRQYKETRRPMGIFRVRNTVTGKSLVGSSLDLPSMLNRQRAQLRLGAHGNKELQRDWDELGAEKFAFEIIDSLQPPDEPDYQPADDLRALELLWLEELAPFGEQGYHPRPRP